jgi:aminocarboxymuconate-semialdehyde decarboxylase
MTSRRNFLAGAAAGVVFCSCGLLDVAHAVQPDERRLPVTIGGKHVKTIDVHSHCNFREVIPLLGGDTGPLLSPVLGAEEAFIEVDKRFKAMDAQAIDIEVRRSTRSDIELR